MSMLRALTDDGFIAFDDLMIYEIETCFGERAIFPWDRQYKGLKAKCFSEEKYDPALFVWCVDLDEVEFLHDFLKESGIRFCIYEQTSGYSGNLSDCIIINLSCLEEEEQHRARSLLALK